MRLLNAGLDALPILAIGNDRIGKNIQSKLLETLRLADISPFVSSFLIDNNGTGFFEPNIQTSSTTIIVHQAKRTIFTQKLRGGEYFIGYVERRLKDALRHTLVCPSAVMIGHIHSDSKSINPSDPGACTKFLIDRFKGKSLVYTNFGKSQISLGFDFWKEYLPYIDIFQLNFAEAKLFFSHKKEESNSLSQVVSTMREANMSAVITLDRFGAIGIHKEEPGSIFISWPVLEVRDVVDPTGAGDAFAAGMVFSLCEQKSLKSADFQSAIGTARLLHRQRMG